MPNRPDDQQRSDRQRAELLAIGLDWNTHYRLVAEGPQWALGFLCMLTPEQYHRAQVILARLTNSRTSKNATIRLVEALLLVALIFATT